MFVAGVDGCSAGWVAFKVELSSLTTSVETVDLTLWLTERPPNLAVLCIDIPIGLLDHPRACDIEARKLLGRPRRSSVFPPPCRAALLGRDHASASDINERATSKRLTLQTWCISGKIEQVDDIITPQKQSWAFEVHPEVSFWALAGQHAMKHRKKRTDGVKERLKLLRREFPEIERHLMNRPPDVGKDDLLDAAVAAWTAQRVHNRQACQVCEPERDAKGLSATIWC